jgi:hypothetical protein
MGILVAILVSLASVCCGCRTLPVSNAPCHGVEFSTEEVLSRTWTNKSGQTIQLVSRSRKSSKRFGDFLIAQYGDRASNEAYYCEFYLVRIVPDRRYTDTTQKGLPEKIMPEHAANSLLARIGSERFVIGPVEMHDGPNTVHFSFEQRAKHEYSITFESPASLAPKKVPVPWHGGVKWQLSFTKTYEPHWTSAFYEDYQKAKP